MKRILAIIATTVMMTSCGGGNSDKNDPDSTLSSSMRANAMATQDSTTKAADSVMMTGDTSSLNKKLGDTTSASGSHGQGSGSGVGGGKTGGPQKKGK